MISHTLGLFGTADHNLLREILIHIQFVYQRVRSNLFNVQNIDHSHCNDLIDHRRVHTFDLTQSFFQDVQTQVELIGGKDVYVPPGKPGRQPDVLASLAYRQRKLILGNHYDGPA